MLGEFRSGAAPTWQYLAGVLADVGVISPAGVAFGDDDPLLSIKRTAEGVEQWVVGMVEGVVMLFAHPDLVIEGLGHLAELAWTFERARWGDRDAQAIVAQMAQQIGRRVALALRGLDYADELGTGIASRGRGEHASADILGRMKAMIVAEVASWFIGLGEVRAIIATGGELAERVAALARAFAALRALGRVGASVGEAARLERVLLALARAVEIEDSARALRLLEVLPESARRRDAPARRARGDPGRREHRRAAPRARRQTRAARPGRRARRRGPRERTAGGASGGRRPRAVRRAARLPPPPARRPLQTRRAGETARRRPRRAARRADADRRLHPGRPARALDRRAADETRRAPARDGVPARGRRRAVRGRVRARGRRLAENGRVPGGPRRAPAEIPRARRLAAVPRTARPRRAGRLRRGRRDAPHAARRAVARGRRARPVHPLAARRARPPAPARRRWTRSAPAPRATASSSSSRRLGEKELDGLEQLYRHSSSGPFQSEIDAFGALAHARGVVAGRPRRPARPARRRRAAHHQRHGHRAAQHLPAHGESERRGARRHRRVRPALRRPHRDAPLRRHAARVRAADRRARGRHRRPRPARDPLRGQDQHRRAGDADRAGGPLRPRPLRARRVQRTPVPLPPQLRRPAENARAADAQLAADETGGARRAETGGRRAEQMPSTPSTDGSPPAA